jgi:hypothetical protein
MAAKRDISYLIDHARDVARTNRLRIERSATRLDDARARLVESAARLQHNHDLLKRSIHDDVAE